MTYRIAGDGSIWFPNRGKPPAVPKGFYRSKEDPFVMKPYIPECDKRSQETRKRDCCPGTFIVWYCDGQRINLVQCLKCKGIL